MEKIKFQSGVKGRCVLCAYANALSDGRIMDFEAPIDGNGMGLFARNIYPADFEATLTPFYVGANARRLDWRALESVMADVLPSLDPAEQAPVLGIAGVVTPGSTNHAIAVRIYRKKVETADCLENSWRVFNSHAAFTEYYNIVAFGLFTDLDGRRFLLYSPVNEGDADTKNLAEPESKPAKPRRK